MNKIPVHITAPSCPLDGYFFSGLSFVFGQTVGPRPNPEMTDTVTHRTFRLAPVRVNFSRRWLAGHLSVQMYVEVISSFNLN